MMLFIKHKTSTKYVSEFSEFMNSFLHQHPEIVADQRKGWSIFWDKKIDFETLKRADKDTVPIDGYYYE